MATAKQICALAKERMKEGCAIISGVDFADGGIDRIQVYFWDENEAAMDIISKIDIIENWPDEGVYVIRPGGGEKDCLEPVRLIDGEEDFYLRTVPGDEEKDDLGDVPAAVHLEALELICQLKDREF